jgi:hypothetical protein
MVSFVGVRPEHVHRALAEYDEVGGDAFLEDHGYGGHRDYVLWHEGKGYDSKAILGVAYLVATGEPLTSEDHAGGKAGAATVLAQLGFEVTAPSAVDVADPGVVPASDDNEPSDDPRSAWAVAARDLLLVTAGQYRALITYKELAEGVQRTTGIRTKRLMHYWIGDVLGRVAAQCAERGEPLLSSLCVNAAGSAGPSYGASVKAATGTAPEDLDEHAADERLKCYQHFGATLPAGGGKPALTAKLSAARSRDRAKRRAVEVATQICPVCQLQLPATGICDNCA